MNWTTPLKAVFVMSVVIAAILAGKLTWVVLPLIGGVAIPAGFHAFSISYLCSDLIVEFEGEETAYELVNATIVALVTSVALIYAAIWMPAAPFYEHAAAFEAVLGTGLNVVIASIVAITISQHADVRLFSAIKRRTGTGHKWMRNIGSTATSQGIDTVVFITLAFTILPTVLGGHVMWGMPLVLTIVGQYIVKLGVALLDTPVFYALSAAQSDNEEVAA